MRASAERVARLQRKLVLGSRINWKQETPTYGKASHSSRYVIYGKFSVTGQLTAKKKGEKENRTIANNNN